MGKRKTPPLINVIIAKLFSLQRLRDQGYDLYEPEVELLERHINLHSGLQYAKELDRRNIKKNLKSLHTSKVSQKEEIVNKVIKDLKSSSTELYQNFQQLYTDVINQFHDLYPELDKIKAKAEESGIMNGYIMELAKTVSYRLAIDPESGEKILYDECYSKPDGTKLRVYFLGDSFNRSEYKQILDEITEEQSFRCDVVAEDITPDVNSEIKTSGDYKFRHFKYRELLYNPTKHMLTPEYELLSPEDKEELFESITIPALSIFKELRTDTVTLANGDVKSENETSLEDVTLLSLYPQMGPHILHRMEYSDPISKWYDYNVGDVVEERHIIFQTDYPLKTDISWRIIIHDIPDSKKPRDVDDTAAGGDPDTITSDEMLMSDFGLTDPSTIIDNLAD